MNNYQLKEPTVQAAVITAVNTVYTLDDGSTQTVPAADQTAIGSYFIVQGRGRRPGRRLHEQIRRSRQPLGLKGGFCFPAT